MFHCIFFFHVWIIIGLDLHFSFFYILDFFKHIVDMDTLSLFSDKKYSDVYASVRDLLNSFQLKASLTDSS